MSTENNNPGPKVGDKSECVHCGRAIEYQESDGGGFYWIDPEATGDDSIWRETCDKHDTFTAEHEPKEVA